MAMLELRGLEVAYGKVQALCGVGLSIGAGEIVALLGANGAGKSTTLRTISGLLSPQSGSVHFDGADIAGLSPEAIVRLGIAHVPEGRRVFPGLTVKENIILGASNRGRVGRRERDEDFERMLAIFPELRHCAGTLGWRLSGGQQQMVAIARGLMARPRVLMLDEPSLGLAPLIVQKVFRVITQIRAQGTTVLLVEQNARMALSVADRGYVLDAGRLVAQGTPAELWADEKVYAAYLGGAARSAAA